MAWTLTTSEFLWFTDLKWGAWAYAGVMTVVVIYCVFVQNLGWGGWIFFLLGAIPMMVSGILIIMKRNDPMHWFYVWTNWYTTFFSFCLGSLQTIIQTIVLSVMIANAGKPRVDYPETPAEIFVEPVSEEIPPEENTFAYNHFDFMAKQGYKALPSRFSEVIALFHDDKHDEHYHAPEIYGERARASLGWIMFGIWCAWGVMAYMTLVNYSYWKKVKTAN